MMDGTVVWSEAPEIFGRTFDTRVEGNSGLVVCGLPGLSAFFRFGISRVLVRFPRLSAVQRGFCCWRDWEWPSPGGWGMNRGIPSKETTRSMGFMQGGSFHFSFANQASFLCFGGAATSCIN